MPDDSRWIGYLVGRIIVHAIMGALFCAFCGSVLIASCGAFVGWAMSTPAPPPGTAVSFYLSPVDLMKLGAAIGASFGGGGGGLVGAIALAVIGFTSPPRRSRLPAKAVLLKVLLGMVVATLTAMVSFFAFVGFIAFAQHSDLQLVLGDWVFAIIYGAPTLMVCGLSAGAMMGSRQQKRLARA